MDSALHIISQSSLKSDLPQFKVGQTIRIHQKIKEGEKERIQVFEGLIIQMSNGTGINGTITVRKLVDGVGVERLFAIHSPFIAKIEITKQAKVRRSKLLYMRERTGKASRLRTTLLEGQVFTPKAFEEEAGVDDNASQPDSGEETEHISAENMTESQPSEQIEELAPEETAPEKTDEVTDEVNPDEPAVSEDSPREDSPREDAPSENDSSGTDEEKKEV